MTAGPQQRVAESREQRLRPPRFESGCEAAWSSPPGGGGVVAGCISRIRYMYPRVGYECEMPLKIQFRESDEAIEDYVARSGLNPNDLAREAFEEKVRSMMAHRRREQLRSRRIQLPKGAAAKWTREERDE